MRIVCVSDTHEQEAGLHIPECDLLIHAGDMTYRGDRHKLLAFDEWCAQLPLPRDRILVCAGNHELTLEKEPWLAQQAFQHCTYLLDESVERDGFKIYASPWQPRFNDWAFNLDRGSEALRQAWARIPDDTDVLVTHCPPYGYGDVTRDVHVGCELLLERVRVVRPKLHVCGHVHEGYGLHETDFGTVVVNASTCDARYRAVNPAVVIEPQ